MIVIFFCILVIGLHFFVMISLSKGKDIERSDDLRSSAKKSQSTLKVTSNECFRDDTPEIPVKKSRRSTSKRKSLLETLQSLPSSPTTQISLAEKVSQNVETSSTPTMQASVVSNALPSGILDRQDAQPCDPSDNIGNEDLQFVFEWYSTLNHEADDWRLLLREHKEREVAAKETLKRITECDEVSTYFDVSDDDRCITSNFAAKIETLEQRLAIASKTIKCFFTHIRKIRNVQQSMLENIKKREIKKLHKCCDPKDIIEKICYYSDMLSKSFIDESTVR